MARSVFKGIRIRGIAGAVPTSRVDNLTDHQFCPAEDRKKIVELTRVKEYRKAPPQMCTSDLCEAAAGALLSGLGKTGGDLDAIVFATLTPDYRVPSTACLMQDRLGASTDIIAYDINMGCSGFIVGLFNACSLIQGAGLERVLLLAGDTQTKLCHDQDKNVVFLLGDGGTATLLEADPAAADIAMEVRTDGSRFQSLYVPAGGCRRPSTAETREVRQGPDGGMRSQDHLYMNGMDIFKFSATDVVRTIAGFMEHRSVSPEDVNGLFLHQANGFMNEKIARKLKIPDDRVPTTIPFYGNTGSASIPLTIAHHFARGGAPGRQRCVLSGFGVGLSWGVADVTLDGLFAPPVVELS